ncbi:MAG TPA: DsbA family protein [Xanthobacteraceae bacterium]|nr:DsbA family protein [Xanthobacteraceae bacterium]
MTLSRRHLLAGIGTAALTGPAFLSGVQVARAQDVSLVELYKAGPLGDKVLGSDSAPVTIVEYASVTCPHCAAFHQNTYPALKSKYIDTGKVKLIFREFPTQPAAVAMAGFMLARCAEDKYYPMLDAIFSQQQSWAQDPYNGLLRIARQAGFSQEKFEACLKDQKLAEQIQAVAQRGNEQFKVESTPTFFINGKKYVGALSMPELEKIVEPLLKSS